MKIKKYCGAAVLIALVSFVFLFSSCEQIFTYSPVSWAVRESNPSYKLAKAIDDLDISISSIIDGSFDIENVSNEDIGKINDIIDAISQADGKYPVSEDQYIMAAACLVILEVDSGTDLASIDFSTIVPDKSGDELDQALYYAMKAGYSADQIQNMIDAF